MVEIGIDLSENQMRDRLSIVFPEMSDDMLEKGGRQLICLLGLLQRWAKRVNLTSVHDSGDIVERHFVDSLLTLEYVQQFGGTVLDLGTGAGFPGLPLAIFSPEQTFILLDGNTKKIAFVRQAVMELELGNVMPVGMHSRVYRPQQSIDTVISRAVGTVLDLQMATRDLLEIGGRLLCMKTSRETGIDECVSGFRFVRRISLAKDSVLSDRCLIEYQRIESS